MATDRHAESDGWVRLDAQRPWVRFLVRNPLNVFDFGLIDINLIAIALSIVFAIVAGIVWLLLVAVVVAAIPRPMIHLTERKIRIGRKTLEFEQVDSARLITSGGVKKREVEFKFGRRGGSQLYVELVAKGKSAVDPRLRDLLLAIVEGSALETADVRARRVREDNAIPRGLTLEDALAVLRNPPLPDESLPRVY